MRSFLVHLHTAVPAHRRHREHFCSTCHLERPATDRHNDKVLQGQCQECHEKTG